MRPKLLSLYRTPLVFWRQLAVVLFDSPLLMVSQGMFSGWKVVDKMTGAHAIPNSEIKAKVGLVWMQVRRTKKHFSVDSNMSEDVMFGSFGNAVLDPSSPDGEFWGRLTPDQLAEAFIQDGNGYMTVPGYSHSR